MLAWGGNHFTPLLHVYETIGHYAPWQANLLLGMYVFGLIPGLLIAAALSDRHGRKGVFLFGMVATVVGSVLLACGLDSFPLLCLGRVLAGIGVGVAMSVGTSWMKELSAPPFDLTASAVAGARRPSLTLTTGFALGAGVTGILAQYAPGPALLPYLVHLGLSLAALVVACFAPETRTDRAPAEGPWWRDLRVPAAGHRRFARVVVPASPWVFGAAGIAYAILPASVEHHLGDSTTLYATVLTVVTLGTGAVVQTITPRWTWVGRSRAVVIAMTAMSAGILAAVIAAALQSPVLGIAVAAFLGGAYGLLVIAGLIQVQRIATAADLAGLTGVYYALAYLGFLLPTVLAALLPVMSYPVSLTVVFAVCLVCLGAVTAGSRRS